MYIPYKYIIYNVSFTLLRIQKKQNKDMVRWKQKKWCFF